VPSVGVLIFFAILGAVVCARARVAGGAVLFGVLAIVLFVTTPAGAGLPGAIAGFLSTLDGAATPVLNGRGGAVG
jgi:hypothetical protein